MLALKPAVPEPAGKLPREKMSGNHRRYAKTPCWPTSPSAPRGNRTMAGASRLAGPEILITEKLDGANTLVHRGNVYGRSGGPAAPWMGIVKKHHAWKLSDEPRLLYGENLYAVHTVEYSPMAPEETFRAFALRDEDRTFEPFDELEKLCLDLEIPVAPALFQGECGSFRELDDLIHRFHALPSAVGGEREGVVVRDAGKIARQASARSVCKSVPKDHVLAGERWSRNWRPCRLARTAEDRDREGK